MSDAAQPTAAEVRAAAEAVKAAIDRHLAAVESRTGEEDPAVYAAFDALAAAAEAYDEALYDAYDEVTPFEVPVGDAGDSLPAYAGPEEPEAISVLIRRDYVVAEPDRLVAQARQFSDEDGSENDENAAAGTGVGAAIGALFGEYEPDEIAAHAAEFGLEEGDSTLWVQAVETDEPGEWLAAPFDQADPELVLCRFDTSVVFDHDRDDAYEDEDVDEDVDEDADDAGAAGSTG